MKKAILFTIAAIISVSSFAQVKTVKDVKSDTVSVHSGYIKLDSIGVVKVTALISFLKTNLVSQSDEYWFMLYQFLKGVKQDKLAPADIDQLVQPFAQYAQAYVQRKQREEQEKKKQ